MLLSKRDIKILHDKKQFQGTTFQIVKLFPGRHEEINTRKNLFAICNKSMGVHELLFAMME